MKGDILMKKAQAVSIMMAIYLMIKIVDMVTKCFKTKQKWAIILGKRKKQNYLESCSLRQLFKMH